MKKFLKAYYPMIISVLFIIIYGFLFGCILGNPAILNEESLFLWILIVVLVLVIAIWAEIIGFIIHVAKNKKLKNPVLWGFMVYLFNIFVIPYYNLKYVGNEKKDKDKNIKVPIIIFSILMVLGFVGGICFANVVSKDYVVDPVYVVSDNKEVQFEFYGNYVERSVGEYELYVSDYYRGINVGVFVYNEDDKLTAKDILDDRNTWIYSSREKVSVMDEYIIEKEDRTITSIAYRGEKDGEAFVYNFSIIEFEDSDYLVNVLEVCFEEDYNDYRAEFKTILESAKLLV